MQHMKTIQMTIDEVLLADVDRVVVELGTNRSAFIRDALNIALHRHAIQKLEERHEAGYQRQPVKPQELDEWLGEQVWDQP